MLKTYPAIAADRGVTRQVLSEHKDLMIVSFKFEAGAEGALHNHPHVQSTFVRSGKFRFTLGEEQIEVGPGDAFIIPSEATHGCVCLEPGELIDSFTPRRDDFL